MGRLMVGGLITSCSEPWSVLLTLGSTLVNRLVPLLEAIASLTYNGHPSWRTGKEQQANLLAEVLEELSQRQLRGCELWVVGRQGPRFDVQGFALEGEGLCCPAQGPQHASQVCIACCHLSRSSQQTNERLDVLLARNISEGASLPSNARCLESINDGYNPPDFGGQCVDANCMSAECEPLQQCHAKAHALSLSSTHCRFGLSPSVICMLQCDELHLGVVQAERVLPDGQRLPVQLLGLRLPVPLAQQGSQVVQGEGNLHCPPYCCLNATQLVR